MTQTASVPRNDFVPATFGAAMRDRATWLMFFLGFASCLPMGWGWYFISHWAGINSADAQINFLVWRWLAVTAISLVMLTGLLLAPMMDSVRAPLCQSLGHRTAWVMTASVAALAMTIAFAAAVLLHRGLIFTDGALLWVFMAVPVAALLISAIDSLRIELRPGPAQALAFLAQFFGALIAYRIFAFLQALEPRSFLATAITMSVMLAVGIVALLALRVSETPPTLATDKRSADATVFSPILGTLGRPWTAYFRRFGAAGAPMLGAIALYAIAASATEFLGTLGHVREVSPIARGDENQRILDIADAIKPLEEILSLIGAMIAAALALRVSPFRALLRLICFVAVFALFYLILKIADGFTVESVIGLYLIKTALTGAEFVTYAVAAAALTARPNTAGQYAVIGFIAAAAWPRSETYNALIDVADGYLIPVVALVAALGAVMLLQLSAWLSRRRRMEAAAQPAG